MGKAFVMLMLLCASGLAIFYYIAGDGFAEYASKIFLIGKSLLTGN